MIRVNAESAQIAVVPSPNLQEKSKKVKTGQLGLILMLTHAKTQLLAELRLTLDIICVAKAK